MGLSQKEGPQRSLPLTPVLGRQKTWLSPSALFFLATAKFLPMGGRRGRESAPKKNPMEYICYQAPGLMPSVWPGWQRSSAHQTFISNAKVCKGRKLSSVSKCALKMQKKFPSQSQAKGVTEPSVCSLPVEKRKKEGKGLRCVWCAGSLLVWNMQPSFLFTLIVPQHNTVILKMCFMKSKVKYSGNLCLNYKQNSANRPESLQIQDRV